MGDHDTECDECEKGCYECNLIYSDQVEGKFCCHDCVDRRLLRTPVLPKRFFKDSEGTYICVDSISKIEDYTDNDDFFYKVYLSSSGDLVMNMEEKERFEAWLESWGIA